jgi:hypothetical protein
MVPASVRRIIDRLDGHAVGVYDATWTLLSWNPLWVALFGDPSDLTARERNTVWRHFTQGPPSRVRQSADESRAFESSMVADLRAIPAFAALWDRQLVAEHEQSRKAVVHPEVGEIDIDCGVLATQRSDLRQSAHHVVAAFDNAGGAAREHIGQTGVAIHELFVGLLAKQREHA